MGDNLGKDIKAAYEFLLGTFEDASRFFEIVEERLTSKVFDFKPTLTDSTVMWNTSSSYKGWKKWMPNYAGRGYKKKTSSKKNKLLRAFVFVHFNPERAEHPILTFGVVETKEEMGVGIGKWTRNVRTRTGPTFFDGELVTKWKMVTEGLDGDAAKIHYQLWNLIEISEKRVIHEICDLLKKKFEALER